jgi:predicted transposase YbfD/YdcC
LSRISGLGAPPYTEHLRQQQLDKHRSVDKGHGRVEIREIEVSSRLDGYLDWPHFKQAIRIKRTRVVKGERSEEYSFFITSLSREQANARDLLSLQRGHWGIENRLHWVRDVTMGEDKCRAKSGCIPQNLAAFRNAALTLLRSQGYKEIASTLRQLAANPRKLVAILKL